jgi:hypothetical protein
MIMLDSDAVRLGIPFESVLCFQSFVGIGGLLKVGERQVAELIDKYCGVLVSLVCWCALELSDEPWVW